MFFNTPGKPTTLKKNIYLISTTILGILFGLLINVAIEFGYLRWSSNPSGVMNMYSGMMPMIWTVFYIAGAVGGYFLGQFWWRWLYVDRVWEKKRDK